MSSYIPPHITLIITESQLNNLVEMIHYTSTAFKLQGYISDRCPQQGVCLPSAVVEMLNTSL